MGVLYNMNLPKHFKWKTLVYFLLILSVILNIWFIKKEVDNKFRELKYSFDLLSPELSRLTTEEFLKLQGGYVSSYNELKISLIRELGVSEEKKFGVYFEDLKTGSWVGLNEKAEFVPASLLKVPTVVAVLKKVEKGELTFNQKIILLSEDLDPNYGVLYKQKPGSEFTVAELINYTILYSDNTALHTLNRIAGADGILQSRLALGLTLRIPGINQSTQLSPKEYSNILRSLYYSTYLRRPFSEYLLNIMTKTQFNDGITSLLPQEINVAHKIGQQSEGNYNHDCGIVYHKTKPYMVCIMSKGTNPSEFNIEAGKLSKIIYDYVSKKNTT